MTQTPTHALRLVPVEPTEAMLDAAFDAFEINHPMQYRTGTEARKAIWSAMLAAAPALPLPGGGWQDISTAPKGNEESTWEPGPDILLYGGYNMAVGYWCNADKEWVTDYRGKGNGDYVSATHWMPLPAAPTGEPK